MSELESFVLGYVKEMGGLVEAAGSKMHEVIIPDGLARQWRVSAYQHLAFDKTNISATTTEPSFTHLSYNHPLVELMIEDTRTRPAPTHFYINDLRLTKTGLVELARSAWGLPNARVVALQRATISRTLHTYIRFNFKAALISDEKQEQLVSILMDAHSGYAAANPSRIYQATSPYQTDPVLKTVSPGPMRWTTADGKTLAGPLASPTLEALFSRAQTTLLKALAEPLTQLQKRSQRFHELDEARLNEYYDEIERDLKQRMSSALPDRRTGLEEKLTAITAERTAKLADAAERYQVSLDLTLLNVMVISQPKLVLPIGIENRSTKIKTYAVWDPLLHRLEPLACKVCGQAGQQILLCHNGHLAHEHCLAPTCIDCKRVFCTTCTDDVGACDVCLQPLCRHSRIICPECGRGTCQAHVGLCHANEGRPVDLRSAPPSDPEPEPPPPKPAVTQPTTPAKSKTAATKNRRSAKSKAVIKPRVKPRLPKGMPKPQRIEVVVDYDSITAYLLASRERELATRVWRLIPDKGIIINCWCEKGTSCPANNQVMRPINKAKLAGQLLDEIDEFRREYGVPGKKVKFNRASGGQSVPSRRLFLLGLWNDESAIIAAQQAFDRL